MQTRMFEYKADDATFALNSQFLSMFEPGVYRGFNFDPDNSVDGCNITLFGDAVITGIDESELPGQSVLFTKQGVVVKEDAAVTVELADNSGVGMRIDAIVCTHRYVLAEGGTPAEYSVIRGSSSLHTYPAIPYPLVQTLIGYMHVPADWGGDHPELLVFERVQSPSIANDPTYARTFLANVFSLMQTLGGVAYPPCNAALQDGKLYPGVILDGDELLFGKADGTVYWVRDVSLEGVIQSDDIPYVVDDIILGAASSIARKLMVVCFKFDLEFTNAGNIKTPYGLPCVVKAGMAAQLIEIGWASIAGKRWLLEPLGFVQNVSGQIVIPMDVVVEGDIFASTTKKVATQEWVSGHFQTL